MKEKFVYNKPINKSFSHCLHVSWFERYEGIYGAYFQEFARIFIYLFENA